MKPYHDSEREMMVQLNGGYVCVNSFPGQLRWNEKKGFIARLKTPAPGRHIFPLIKPLTTVIEQHSLLCFSIQPLQFTQTGKKALSNHREMEKMFESILPFMEGRLKKIKGGSKNVQQKSKCLLLLALELMAAIVLTIMLDVKKRLLSRLQI